MNRKVAIGIVLGLIAMIIVGSIIALSAGGPKDENPAPSTVPSTSSMPNQTADAGSAAATTNVEIVDYAYTPATIKIKAGQTVTWTNKDAMRHDVVSDDAVQNGPMSDLLGKGQSYSYTFDETGTYNYYCSPHPYMKGTVIVE